MITSESKYILTLGLAAFVGSLVMTVIVKRWAIKHDFVDRPGHRKIHTHPIALGGGIVIFWITMLPIIFAATAAYIWSQNTPPDFIPHTLAIHIPGLSSRARLALILLAAATLLHVMGLIDDRKHLGPAPKLLVQFLAAFLLVVVGKVRFGFFIPNPWVTSILSILWMVVIINAFNFLDNMDGLSAGIGLICAGMILSAAWSSGQVFVSSLLVLLMGALAGFLVFNFAPAKIFMGDAGSLLVGLLLSVATIQTTYYHQDPNLSGAWFNTLMPLIVLAVPLYDFTSVTIIRMLQGKSPFVGDKQHFSHRLVRRGMTHRQAVLTIYLATACTGLGATFLNELSPLGVLLVFIQTLLILFIIAILEKQ
ncbi:MAG: undecaprenyl/decaprenyl-phosphate alpha-N-acetylglucosaminyl 1-phosphate transferase [Sedimentisphaerales bacterium]|nr:undecaprenyl/decaprenyl-phosphate alpha-N-acetylglucosaminyl 1-phosphate transferase [Sedimentisphaerales bacterium]